MRRWIRLLAVSAVLPPIALLTVVRSEPESEPEPGKVIATLELSQQFYYAGEPLFIRVSVGNDGGTIVDNPVRGKILERFIVKRDGKALEQVDPEPGSEPARPGKLAPRTFYGAVVDLTEVVPALASPGEYEISWASDGVESQSITVRLLPRYDPEKDYVATVDTDRGSFKVEFFKEQAPVATQAFIDMANAGFYDGLLIHEVQRDRYVSGGDAVASGAPRSPFVYPAETSTLPVVAGSVLLKPVRPYPPSNGSTFIVALRPEPSWTGQVTVLGQVVEGLSTLRTISRVETNREVREPFHRPVEDIRIRQVTVTEKPSAEG